MSTPPKRDAKAAAKRRADARRRNREIGRHLFAYGIIAILVIGTVATVLVPSAVAPTGTVVPIVPTQPANSGFDQLLTQADQEVAASNWLTATGLYRAYLGQNPNRADVHLKLARAIISSPSPNYVEASQSLQQAISFAGQDNTTASEADTLLTQIQPQLATAIAAGTATSTVSTITSTIALTATTAPLATTTGSTTTASPQATQDGPVGPVPITGTVTIAPAATPTK